MLNHVAERQRIDAPAGSAILRPYLPSIKTWRSRSLALCVLAGLGGGAFLMGRQFTAAPHQLTLLVIPLAVLALVVVWALPQNYPPPLSAMEFTFFAVLVALILWPNYLGLTIPGLPWITMMRLFGLPMFFFFIISLSVSTSFRIEISKIVSVAPPVWKILAGIAALQLLSMPFSTVPMSSLQKVILFQIYGTAIVLIAAYVCMRPGRAMLWVAIFTACVVPICLIGLIEQRQQQVLWVGHIPSFLSIEDPLVAKILQPKARAASGIYRIQGPATTSLGLAEYLAFVTPFVMHMVATARNHLLRFGALVMVPVIFMVIVATDSRLGIVGFILSVLFYMLFWGTRSWVQNRGSLFGPALTLSFPFMLVTTIVASFFVARFRHLVWGSGAQQYSTDSRKEQILLGIPRVLQRPFGYGVGRGAEVLGYTNLSGVLTIDSYFLLVALDIGPIGLVLFVSLFLYTAYRAFVGSILAKTAEESLLAPIAITFVNFIVIKAIFAQDANHPLIFMMVGVALALLYKQQRRIATEAA